MDQDKFEPLLGRLRAPSSRSGRRATSGLIAAANRAGGMKGGRRGTGCSRIGRGAAAGKVLRAQRRSPAFRARRAIVKTRLVRLSSTKLGAARAHLAYIQRDGVGRDGSPGRLYSAADDGADGREFAQRCSGDRHQFRIILSAEDGSQYEDLKPLVRRFMARMEQDLGTRLEWVAADHTDTLHPHSHIVLRGRDEHGGNLVIARDYIAGGMRERAAELVSLDLGPRTAAEVEHQLRQEVSAERLTSIDRSLVRSMDQDRLVKPGGRTMAEHSIRVGRLRRLEALGLAQAEPQGRWRLDAELEPKLRALSERGDIIRTMQRAMSRAGIQRPATDLVVEPAAGDGVLLGRMVERGLADEMTDRTYLLIDACDGRLHHVRLSAMATDEPMPTDAIVRCGPPAGRRGEGRRVEVLSLLPLDQLHSHDGSTWLDHELAAGEPAPHRHSGFGRELNTALALRRAWLLAEQLAVEEEGRFQLKPHAVDELDRRGLANAAARLRSETGLEHASPQRGERVSGILRRPVDLASARFAMIENGREFMLLPWRKELSSSIGHRVSAEIRKSGIDWSLGRTRGIER